MTLIFASSNPHKLEEVAAVLEPLGLDVLGLNEVAPDIDEPVEDGDTFIANARIKAVAYARALRRPCLADDSGLVVDALDGAPGIHSARYAGTGDTRAERDAANNAKLLTALADTPDDQRTARFVCTMCLVDADGRIHAEADGTFDGRIGHQPQGANGFGYDPLLYLPDLDCTAAELSPEDKNARSHRGAATRAIARDPRGTPAGLRTHDQASATARQYRTTHSDHVSA